MYTNKHCVRSWGATLKKEVGGKGKNRQTHKYKRAQ